MDAMLMGGIVPTDLTPGFVEEYLNIELPRSKSFKWQGRPFSAKTWGGLIDQICPDQRRAIVQAISDFLQASSSYGLIDGVRGLQVLRAARVQLINLGRPAVDLAIRIMKDMRKPVNSRAAIARQTFYSADDPHVGVRHMQFAPGFGYFNKELTALPKTLQKRLDDYIDNPARMRRSAVRARTLIQKKYPNYRVPFTMPLVPSNFQIPLIRRVSGDTTVSRSRTTDAVRKARAAQAQRTLTERYAREYAALDPLYQFGEAPIIVEPEQL